MPTTTTHVRKNDIAIQWTHNKKVHMYVLDKRECKREKLDPEKEVQKLFKEVKGKGAKQIMIFTVGRAANFE